MADNKIIAALVVVILVVAAVGAYLVIGGGDDDKLEDRTVTGRLQVFGNADNDDVLDKNDVKFIEHIIEVNNDGDKTNDIDWKNDYPYADANNDGKVDQADVEWVKKMVNRESMKIYFVDGNNKTQSIDYPVGNIVAAGIADVYTSLLCMGATSKVVAVNSGYSGDKTLYADFAKLPVVGSSAPVVDIDAVAEVRKTTSIDAIVTDTMGNMISNEDQFVKAGIPVLRMAISDAGKYAQAMLTTGYLLGLEESTQKFVAFSDGIMETINSKVGNLKDSERTTCLAAFMTTWVAGTGHIDNTITTLAGAKNIADWPMSENSNHKVGDGATWIYNYDPDVITNRASVGYGAQDAQALWDKYCLYFEKMDAYKDGEVYFINGSVPVCVRLAYMATIYYPDLFGTDFGSNANQEFVDEYVSALSGKYDVTKDGVFVVSKDMVKA